MITKIDYGKHKNITHIEMGKGDVSFCTVPHEKGIGLVFSSEEEGEIGRETDTKGLSTDELDNIGVLLTFSKIESISYLIHKLVEAQMIMLKESTTKQ
jgi:hypothetical protein